MLNLAGMPPIKQLFNVLQMLLLVTLPFDTSCPVTVQVDASHVRLGAALLKDNKPVTFTSKALTEVECHYVNIECEVLGVVFGAEWFNTYVYGRPFTIESDHKPLELIAKKSLADTHLPGCSACYYACKGMIMFFATALERKWPSQIHFHISSQSLALRLHWILPSTMPACPLSKRKPPPTGLWDGCWDVCPSWNHHLWLAQWHQGSPMPTVSLLATPWVTHFWRWTCVPWRSPHHPYIRKGEGPWYSAPITSRHYLNTIACLWLCFLAWYQQGHWGSC